MPTLLVSPVVLENHAAELQAIRDAATIGGLEIISLPPDGQATEELVESISAAFISTDLTRGGDIRRYFGAIRRAPNIEWLHIGWAGTDAPVVQELMDRGVKVSNSSGVTSEPIALTVIGAMLSLHRGFPRWNQLQREKTWLQRTPDEAPPDLRGQTMTVLGLGAIGAYIAQFAKGFGLHVIGVRRTPCGPGDPVDEWCSPDRLRDVLPRTDWLAITIPLTSATRGLIGRDALALLPRGAHILNVARGAIIDEDGLIESLRDGHIAGAYLDVFTTEPLDTASPLWEMPNVIVSPHDSSPSQGNQARAERIFLEELQRWATGQPVSRLVTER
jgi:D-2-hydroxyacid dehydrogenase (NADP+)